MKDGGAVIVIDNTTFASAGRAMYFEEEGDIKGAEHARSYYAANHDAPRLDIQSLSELLSAMTVAEKVVWEGSSDIEEAHEFHFHGRTRAPWVYDWFPVFGQARRIGLIDCVVTDAKPRLKRARLYAMEWVKQRVVTGSFKLPRGFRVPLTYFSPYYDNRWAFEELNWKYSLDEYHLAIAMFLHRGLFYQSRVCSEPNWSYLPHSYRAALMYDPELQALSLLCDQDELGWGMTPEPIPPAEILRSLDQAFYNELQQAVKMPAINEEPIPACAALGAAFLNKTKGAPLAAFNEMLEFRETPAGSSLRDEFKSLIKLGAESNKVGIQNRLNDFSESLRAVARSRFGAAWKEDPNEAFLLNLFGPWKDVASKILSYVPRTYRESVTKILNKPLSESGFQLLFRYYLQ